MMEKQLKEDFENAKKIYENDKQKEMSKLNENFENSKKIL